MKNILKIIGFPGGRNYRIKINRKSFIMLILDSSFALMIAFWIVYGVTKPKKRWAKITAIVFTVIWGIASIETGLGLL